MLSNMDKRNTFLHQKLFIKDAIHFVLNMHALEVSWDILYDFLQLFIAKWCSILLMLCLNINCVNIYGSETFFSKKHQTYSSKNSSTELCSSQKITISIVRCNSEIQNDCHMPVIGGHVMINCLSLAWLNWVRKKLNHFWIWKFSADGFFSNAHSSFIF